MFRRMATFAALLVAAPATVPCASAATVDNPVIIASGSSAQWTTIALAAYNRGKCATASVTVHPPCFHYTDSTKFNLNDTRPTLKGGSTDVDTGDLWIVWDSPTGTEKRNLWVYVKVDSVVGDRCFFANPACNITAPAGYDWATVGNKISSTLWGSDTVPPTDVQSVFTSSSGLTVNTAATDIRPEDAQFAICRTNSALGKGVFNDGLDGLGYGKITPPGTCPAFGAPLSQLVGTPVKSGLSGSTATANVLAFNISGKDPFSGNTVTNYTVVDVGASPVTFIVSKTAGLASAKTASDTELQSIFSGEDCNASELGLPSAPISVFLREPLSGTMNTTEASVFRRPIENLPTDQVIGTSQEKNVGATNPLSNTACVTGGGTRTRGIGTSEVVSGVHGAAGTGTDGMAYTFFSFGNVSSIAGSSSYGYLTLDGIDPIGPYKGEVDQELPTCTAPCTEVAIWGSTGGSFPELRAGNYPSWSLLRMVTSSVHESSLTDLVKGSNTYVVEDTPDYIPALASSGDPGLKIFHTHYQQRSGTNGLLGPTPTNGTFKNGNPVGGDKGGDMGGCTISTKGITSTTDIGYIQIGPSTTCSDKKVRK
jgi:hypothetical protein